MALLTIIALVIVVYIVVVAIVLALCRAAALGDEALVTRPSTAERLRPAA